MFQLQIRKMGVELGFKATLDLLRVVKYLSGEREDSARNVPLLFVASPSAKDPTWEERSPGKEAGPRPSRPAAARLDCRLPQESPR